MGGQVPICQNPWCKKKAGGNFGIVARTMVARKTISPWKKEKRYR